MDDYKVQAQNVATEKELNDFIAVIASDWALSMRRYEYLRNMAIDAYYDL